VSTRLNKLFVVLPQSQSVFWGKQQITNRHSKVSRIELLESQDGTRSAVMRGMPFRLGFDQLTTLTVGADSILGLWKRHMEMDVTLGFRVLPKRAIIPEEVFSSLIRGSHILSQSRRLLMRGVSEDQFHSTRPYQYPDSIRRIDPIKSAKFGTLMTREYDAFHSHQLILALDASRVMLGNIGSSRKFDYAISASLSLAEMALRSGDRVGALVFHEHVEWMARSTNTLAAFSPLYEGKSHIQPRDCGAAYKALPSFIQAVERKRSVVIIFTDTTQPGVAQNLLPQLEKLSRTHLVLLLSLLDEQFDLQSFLRSSTDLESEADLGHLLYKYWVHEQQRLFNEQVARRGMSSLTLPQKYFLSGAQKAYGLLRTSLAN
jgi:uncharacterized protein (DUF58 family)